MVGFRVRARVRLVVGVEVPAGAGAVFLAGVTVLVNVKAMNAVGLEAFDMAGHMHDVAHFFEIDHTHHIVLRRLPGVGGVDDGHGFVSVMLVCRGVGSATESCYCQC